MKNIIMNPEDVAWRNNVVWYLDLNDGNWKTIKNNFQKELTSIGIALDIGEKMLTILYDALRTPSPSTYMQTRLVKMPGEDFCDVLLAFAHTILGMDYTSEGLGKDLAKCYNTLTEHGR